MGKEIMARCDTVLIGAPEEVSNVLRSAADRGDLIDCGEPLALADGRVELWVTMMLPVQEPEPIPPTVHRRPTAKPLRRHRAISWRVIRRRLVLALKVTFALVVLAGCAIIGYGAYLAVQWVLAHLLLVAGGFVALLVVVGLMLGKSGGCSGIHCGGCGHR